MISEQEKRAIRDEWWPKYHSIVAIALGILILSVFLMSCADCNELCAKLLSRTGRIIMFVGFAFCFVSAGSIQAYVLRKCSTRKWLCIASSEDFRKEYFRPYLYLAIYGITLWLASLLMLCE